MLNTPFVATSAPAEKGERAAKAIGFSSGRLNRIWITADSAIRSKSKDIGDWIDDMCLIRGWADGALKEAKDASQQSPPADDQSESEPKGFRAATGDDVKNDPEASGLNSAGESRNRSRRETVACGVAPRLSDPIPVEPAAGAALRDWWAMLRVKMLAERDAPMRGDEVILHCNTCRVRAYELDTLFDTAAQSQEVAALRELQQKVDTLFHAIEHGDDRHRSWLLDKINMHFYNAADLPMPGVSPK